MAKKKHVCRPTSCPCACAVKPKRRKTRTVPSNLPPRQSPIEALVALMGTRLLNPEPQIKQQQSQGQTLIQKKSVETQAEPTRVSMETQYETPARLRPPVPPARLPPPLPPPRQTLALPSAMPPSRLFPPGYGAGYETPAPPPARLPLPGYGEQYGRVFDAEILKGKTREQIKKLPPVLLTEQVKSARERSAMAKEDKGSLGARKVIKLKKTKPKEVEVMPIIMEDQMEELAKSLEAEGGGRLTSEDVRSVMRSTPSERVRESMETQTEPAPTRTSMETQATPQTFSIESQTAIAPSRASMETQTASAPFGFRQATEAEIGRRERSDMRREDKLASQIRSVMREE